MYVVLPLLPAFEGDVGVEGSSSLKTVLYWTYRSLTRGPYSLFEYLKNSGILDPGEYIQFCSLRTHGKMKVTDSYGSVKEKLVRGLLL